MPVEKTVEIDEAELLRLRRTSDTVSRMIKDPSAKRQLLQALKTVNPDDPSVKELDRPDPVEARFEALQTELAAEKKARLEAEATREQNAKLDKIRAEQEAGFGELRKANWTQDGIEKVRAVMQEKGILDVAIAAKWIESQMPPQNPIAPTGSSWNFAEMPPEGSNDDFKRLMDSKGEDDSLLRKMAGEALVEVRGAGRR